LSEEVIIFVDSVTVHFFSYHTYKITAETTQAANVAV